MKKNKKITLQAWLERQYGKNQIAVKQWKWTPEQLEQLQKSDPKKKSPPLHDR